MTKLLSIIDDFIKLLNNNNGSVSNSNYDDRYKEIRDPIIFKKTQDETFSTIMFFGGNDGIERLPNFIYRIINPYVPASNTDKDRKKPILSRTTAQEFINSSTNVAKALYYFMKYKAKYSR